MDHLCEVCDRSIWIINPNMITMLFHGGNYINNNINLDEVDKLLDDYVTTHNKNFLNI